MASIYRIEVTVEDILCPYCKHLFDDERLYGYTNLDQVLNYECSKCLGEFDLKVDASADVDLVETKEPPLKKQEDLLATGLLDVEDPNQLKLDYEL